MCPFGDESQTTWLDAGDAFKQGTKSGVVNADMNLLAFVAVCNGERRCEKHGGNARSSAGGGQGVGDIDEAGAGAGAAAGGGGGGGGASLAGFKRKGGLLSAPATAAARAPAGPAPAPAPALAPALAPPPAPAAASRKRPQEALATGGDGVKSALYAAAGVEAVLTAARAALVLSDDVLNANYAVVRTKFAIMEGRGSVPISSFGSCDYNNTPGRWRW